MYMETKGKEMTDAVKEALIDLVEELLDKTKDRDPRGRAALVVAMIDEAQIRYEIRDYQEEFNTVESVQPSVEKV